MNIFIPLTLYGRPDKKGVFYQLPSVLHLIIWCGYLVDTPLRGDSIKYPQHMISGKIYHFLSVKIFLQRVRVKLNPALSDNRYN